MEWLRLLRWLVSYSNVVTAIPPGHKRIHIRHGFDPPARAASLPGVVVGGDTKAGIASLPANVQLGVGRDGTDAYTSARSH